MVYLKKEIVVSNQSAKGKMVKRKNGSGSYFQRRDGRWVAKVWDPTSDSYKYKYASTRNKAEEALRQMLSRVESHSPVLDSGMTFDVYATEWLLNRAGKRRSGATVYEYQSRLTLHVYPYIGKVPLSRITMRDIEDVLDKVAAQGLSPSSVKAIFNAIAALFSDAVKDRAIVSNPALGAQLPVMMPDPQKPSPTTQEVRSILAQAASMKGDAEAELGRLLVMCAHTGARIGEILASKWSDIDLDAQVWALSRTTTKDRTGKVCVGNRTKSGEARLVSLSDDLTRALRTQREAVAYRRSMSPFWVDEGWVFPSGAGTVRDAHNLRTFLKRTFPDWPHVFHGFRHWFISIGLSDSGTGSMQVSRLVGHKSTKTTTDRYGHLLEEGAAKVIGTVSAALSEE